MLARLLRVARHDGDKRRAGIDTEEYVLRYDERTSVSGYEIILRRGGESKKTSIDPEVMRSFIDTIREKIPRTASVYLVTLVRRHYGGSYILCVDRNERVDRVCELFAATLETLSRGVIKTKRLRGREIREIVFLKNIQGGELPEIHSLYAETIDIGDVNYSIKDGLDREGIFIGETSRTKIRARYSIPVRDLVRHIAIFGSTGSGKSTTAATIAYRAARRGVRTYILDWHGEYREIIGGPYVREVRIESLSVLESLPVFRSPTHLAEVFETVLELTPAQSYVLGRVLNRLRDREISFERIYDEISVFPEEARWVSETKLSLLRKIEPLLDDGGGGGDGEVVRELSEKREGVGVFDLSGIERTSMRSLATLLIIKSLSMIKQESYRGQDLRRLSDRAIDLIVVDEAHHVFKRSEGSSVIRDLLAEIRKYSIGLVIVTQSPSTIGDDVMKNTNTKIIHSIRSDVDRKILRDSMVVSREIEEVIPLLEVGEAVVSTASNPHPIIVKVSPVSPEEL